MAKVNKDLLESILQKQDNIFSLLVMIDEKVNDQIDTVLNLKKNNDITQEKLDAIFNLLKKAIHIIQPDLEIENPHDIF